MVDVSALEGAQLLERLTDDSSWTVLGLDPAVKGKQRVYIQAIGDGDLSAVTSALKDDQVSQHALQQ
jgi:hypothetical protein